MPSIREARPTDAPALAQLAESVTLESDPAAEIAGLVVEKFRGAGIGARLVAQAETWAAGEGYGLLRVRSSRPEM